MIGKIAQPDQVFFLSTLPKTRSGKILRRLLRKMAQGQTVSPEEQGLMV